MVRMARTKSNTGIYHIMLRGIDKRNIFLDDEDRAKFIEKIRKAKEIAGFNLYGYCLMDNHVHMLIKEQEEIGTSIKRITVGYVQWHNRKHDRTGHLFQNRYNSETVETDEYLVNVLRYIHQNPVKAKMTDCVKNYPWSSYHQYILESTEQDSLIDVALIKSYFSSLEDFENYMNMDAKEEFLEYKLVRKNTDVDIKNIIEKQVKIQDFMQLSVEERNRIIKDTYHQLDVSIRQLARVLGIGKTLVEKAIR